MIRKLAVLAVFSVSALFFATIVCADQAGLPDGALSQVAPIDKLLMAVIVSPPQNAFEQRMAGVDGCPVVIKREITSLQDEMNERIASAIYASRASGSSA